MQNLLHELAPLLNDLSLQHLLNQTPLVNYGLLNDQHLLRTPPLLENALTSSSTITLSFDKPFRLGQWEFDADCPHPKLCRCPECLPETYYDKNYGERKNDQKFLKRYSIPHVQGCRCPFCHDIMDVIYLASCHHSRPRGLLLRCASSKGSSVKSI